MKSTKLRKSNRIVSTLGSAALLLVPSLCLAQGHPYVGGAIGNAILDDGGQFDDAGRGNFDLDDSAMALGAYGGYQFNRYLAVEGALKWLGRYESEVSKQRYGALTGSVLGILPIGESGFEFYGQAGIGWVAMWGPDYDSEIEDEIDDKIAAVSFGPAFLLGAGARYTPPSVPRLTLRAGYEQYFYNLRFSVLAVETEDDGINFDTKDDDLKQSIGSWNIGAQYNF